MLEPSITKNDKKARQIIWVVSLVVFAVIVVLSKYKLTLNLGFDVHYFALASAIINSMVAVFLVAALVAVKQAKYLLHKRLMLSALVLSVLFLVCYIAHHLLAGETKFGGTGGIKYFYYFILATHIPLAAIILPFILFTAYRGLVSEFEAHKKLARITWPIWFYVAVTGPLVYWLICPYYVH